MITINGTPLSTYGLVARDRSPLPLGAARQVVMPIPGGFPVRAGAIIQPGRISVAGTLRAVATGTLATDHATLLGYRDSLGLALQGEAVIRFDDFTDREWVGYLDERSALSLHDPAWLQRGGALSLEWTIPDPRARAQTETERIGSGSLILGTAPSPLRVAVTTASATIRVRAGGAAGTILTELIWTGASGALVVDRDTQNVTRDGANAIEGITADSVFPVADPALGADYVEVPAGATVTYRRRWW